MNRSLVEVRRCRSHRETVNLALDLADVQRENARLRSQLAAARGECRRLRGRLVESHARLAAARRYAPNYLPRSVNLELE